MLALDIAVKFDDGTEQKLQCKTSDFLAFEAHFDKSFDVLAKDARLTYIMFLAWSAAKRAKLTELELAEWADSVANVEAESPKA